MKEARHQRLYTFLITYTHKSRKGQTIVKDQQLQGVGDGERRWGEHEGAQGNVLG